jgi:hypothetical protein
MAPSHRRPRCNFCLKELTRASHVQLHIQNSKKCREAWNREVERHPHLSRSNKPSRKAANNGPVETDIQSQFSPDDDDFFEPFIPSPRRHRSESPEESESQSKRARVDDAEDDDSDAPRRFCRNYPRRVADVIGDGQTEFERIRAQQASSNSPDNLWAPFQDEEEWSLAEWLIKETTQQARDKFLKLPIVSA